MAKKDSTKKSDKKINKEKMQPVVEIETPKEESVKDDVETKVVVSEETIPQEEKIEEVEDTPSINEKENDYNVESIEEMTEDPNEIVVEEQVKKTEEIKNTKKKQITTNDMFGYNWMGQIYDY